jgi:hypothetical protein
LTIKAADSVVEARGDGGAEDTMAVGQLAEALSALAVPQDNFAIQGERFSSYVPAFESDAAHPGPDSLDERVAFKPSTSRKCFTAWRSDLKPRPGQNRTGRGEHFIRWEHRNGA